MSKKDLIPFNRRTKEEQKVIASQGGKASGEARRRKAARKNAALFALSLCPDLPTEMLGKMRGLGIDPDADVLDMDTLAAVKLAQQAIKGDIASYKYLREVAGLPSDTQSQVANKRSKLEDKRLKMELDRASGATDVAPQQIIIHTDGDLEVPEDV